MKGKLADFREYSLNIEDRRVAMKNYCLRGLTIAVAVTGGIGAVEVPKCIRELRRFGAEVRVYPTSQALKFITPLSLEWASGNPIITSLSATAEQVLVEDILLIIPATANIIAKAAVGIADESVSTLIAGAMGKRKYILDNYPDKTPPVLIMMPAMHAFLSVHPQHDSHRHFLSDNGVIFLKPRRDPGEEDKLKIPSPEDIAIQVSHAFYKSYYQFRPLSRQTSDKKTSQFNFHTHKVMITAGPTSEPIDGVRFITNRGTGETGITLTKYLYSMGVNVHLLISESMKKSLPSYLKEVSFFEDYISYQEQVSTILKDDRITWGIFSAAVSDFKPKSFREEKMASEETIAVKLFPQSKIIAKVRKSHPKLVMVVFKYTVGKSVQKLISMGKKMSDSYDYVAANRKEDIGFNKKTRYFFKSGDKEPRISYSDIGLAEFIVEALQEYPRLRKTKTKTELQQKKKVSQ